MITKNLTILDNEYLKNKKKPRNHLKYICLITMIQESIQI